MGNQMIEAILISGIISAITSAVITIIAMLIVSKRLSMQIEQALQNHVENKTTIEPKPPAVSTKEDLPSETKEESKESALESAKPPVDTETEEPDEANILTGSDLSHHVPQIARFKDLEIPSLTEHVQEEALRPQDVPSPIDSSQSEAESSKPEDVVEDTEEDAQETVQNIAPPAIIDDQDTFIHTVPEAGEENDDDATVLVQRTPPQ